MRANFISFSSPSGSFSSSSSASLVLLTLRMKTTPRSSYLEYHCSSLPPRYKRTVARTSLGMISRALSAVNAEVRWPTARTRVVETGESSDCPDCPAATVLMKERTTGNRRFKVSTSAGQHNMIHAYTYRRPRTEFAKSESPSDPQPDLTGFGFKS